VLEPLDLMARLAALVPTPRMHLTRHHGVFAPLVTRNKIVGSLGPDRRLKFLSAQQVSAVSSRNTIHPWHALDKALRSAT